VCAVSKKCRPDHGGSSVCTERGGERYAYIGKYTRMRAKESKRGTESACAREKERAGGGEKGWKRNEMCPRCSLRRIAASTGVDTYGRAWVRGYIASRRRPRAAKKPRCRPGVVSKHRRIYRVSHCSFAFVCSPLPSLRSRPLCLSLSLSLFRAPFAPFAPLDLTAIFSRRDA